jgi:hypothetical protein
VLEIKEKKRRLGATGGSRTSQDEVKEKVDRPNDARVRVLVRGCNGW